MCYFYIEIKIPESAKFETIVLPFQMFSLKSDKTFGE